jgi:hypothetical protein
LPYLVSVSTPYPAIVTVLPTPESPKAAGKLIVSVSDWKSGVDRVISNIMLTVVCTAPVERLMLEKVLGWTFAIVMLQESTAPIVLEFVCV